MNKLCKFSFKEAAISIFPTDDIQKSKSSLENMVEDLIRSEEIPEEVKTSYSNTRDVFKKNLNTLFILFQSPNLDTEEETVDSTIESLEALKETWIKSASSNKLEVYGGYFLNLNCLPTAITFYKHLSDTYYIHRNYRVTRASFENEYKVWNGRNDLSFRFSHVLFALSWLGLLRVHNNSTIVINNRPNITM